MKYNFGGLCLCFNKWLFLILYSIFFPPMKELESFQRCFFAVWEIQCSFVLFFFFLLFYYFWMPSEAGGKNKKRKQEMEENENSGEVEKESWLK